MMMANKEKKWGDDSHHRSSGQVADPFATLMDSVLGPNGECVDRIREHLRRTYPTTEIANVPREELLKVICCVRCGDIPHPDEVMCCVQGHFTCGPCVETDMGKDKEKDGTSQVNLKDCCVDLRKLNKGGSHFLKDCLTKSQFKCRNHERGCEAAVPGDLMEEHYENCKFTEHAKCRFHNCTQKYAYLDDLLEHYKRDHQATILEGVGNSILMPSIDFKQTMAQRLCAILKIEGLFYIFGCEVVSGYIFIWLWSMEHPVIGGTGLKTGAWYNLRLKKPPGKISPTGQQSLGFFEGRCLGHCVDPEVICKANGSVVESFKMKMDLFQKLYVNEKDHRSGGGWTVAVLVNDRTKAKPTKQ